MSDELSIRTPTYRVPRSRGMDPATKRLALIAVVLGTALLGVVGAWSVIGHRPGGIPVIAPPPGPMRVKPSNPGGMQLAGESADLFSPGGAGSDPGDGRLAPPPEVPDPQALRPPPAPPPAHVVPAPGSGPIAAVPGAPAAAVAARAPVIPAPTAPAIPSPPAPVAKPVAAAQPAPASAAPAGPVQVQLAALPTEQAAKDEWALLQHRMPDLLQARQPAISRVDLNGRTWWRVRTGGFGDPAEAGTFCGKVKAKGGACDVIRS